MTGPGRPLQELQAGGWDGAAAVRCRRGVCSHGASGGAPCCAAREMHRPSQTTKLTTSGVMLFCTHLNHVQTHAMSLNDRAIQMTEILPMQ